MQNTTSLRRSEFWTFVRSKVDPYIDDEVQDDLYDNSEQYGYFGNGNEIDLEIDDIDEPNNSSGANTHNDTLKTYNNSLNKQLIIDESYANSIENNGRLSKYNGHGVFYITDIPAILTSMDPNETNEDYTIIATNILLELISLYPEASMFKLYKLVDPEESFVNIRNAIDIVSKVCWGPSALPIIKEKVSLVLKLSILLQASKAQNNMVAVALHDGLRAILKSEDMNELKTYTHIFANICENIHDQIYELIVDRAKTRTTVKSEQVQSTFNSIFEFLFIDNGMVWLGDWSLMLRICEKYFYHLSIDVLNKLLLDQNGIIYSSFYSVHFLDIATKIILTLLNSSRIEHRILASNALKIFFGRIPKLEYSTLGNIILQPILESLLNNPNNEVLIAVLPQIEHLAVNCSEDLVKIYIKFLIQCILNTRSSSVESILMLAELLNEKEVKGYTVVTPGDAGHPDRYSEYGSIFLLRLFYICAWEYHGKCILLIFKYLVRLPTFFEAPLNGRKIILHYLLQIKSNAKFVIRLPKLQSLQYEYSQSLINNDINMALFYSHLPNIVNENVKSAVYTEYVDMPDILCYKISKKIDNFSDKGLLTSAFDLKDQQVVLPIAQYCAAILLTFTREKKAEILLLILTLFAKQLESFHYFRTTGPQLTVIRSYLCNLVSNNNSLGEVASGLSPEYMNGVTLIVINSMKVLSHLMMYKHLFNKKDTEEILTAFLFVFQKQHHIGKQCLQSLFLSMFEYPQGMIKVVPGTLLKISQTFNPSMAISSLEFLVSLGQRRELCVNFTDDDFKKVFMVAINYIQSPSSRLSQVSLSYVVHLAFEVLNTWFLRLKLHDRKSMMQFIIQYLLKVSSSSNGGKLDENAELVLDFLYGNVFFEAETSTRRVDVSNSEKTQSSKYWVYGNTILNISVDKHDPSLGHVIIRRPSGVFKFTLKNESAGLSNSLVLKLVNEILNKHKQMVYDKEASIRNSTESIKLSTMYHKADALNLERKPIGISFDDSVLSKSFAKQTGFRRNIGSFTNSSTDDIYTNRNSDKSLIQFADTNHNHPSIFARSVTDNDIAFYPQSNSGKSVVRGRSASLSSATINQLKLDTIIHSIDNKDTSSNKIGDSTQNSSSLLSSLVDAQSPKFLSSKSPNEVESINAKSPSFISPIGSLLSPNIDRNYFNIALTLPIDLSMDPSFLISQFLPYNANHQTLLPSDACLIETPEQAFIRSVSVLDRTPTTDLHKIGIIYIGNGQFTESEFLANEKGSVIYTQFLRSIGNFVRLKECTTIYTGGLDTSSDLDGKYAVYLQEDFVQLIFHVTTLMPTNLEIDKLCTFKKRHIGNDFVNIIWNESGKDYTSSWISAQFNYVNIVIEPLSWDTLSQGYTAFGDSFTVRESDFETMVYKVYVILSNDFNPTVSILNDPILCSGIALPSIISTCATLYNTYAQIFQISKDGREFISATKERSRQINKIKEKYIK